MPAHATPPAVAVSFLDPYEKNRRISLITWLRLGFWGIVLGISALVWWLVAD